MSRTITTAVQSELAASAVRPFYLFEAEFVSATVRLWSGVGDLSWDSNTWLGNGWFRGLSSIKETGAIEANGIEVILSGVPSSLVSLVLSDAQQNLPGRLYLGFFDAAWAVIADPVLLYEGGLDVPKITDSQNDSTISLSYESLLVFLKKKKELRFTDQLQKQLFPGDKGFEFINSLAEWSGYWGKKVEPPTSKKRKSSKKS